jgi:hypothetical protein
MDDKEVVIAKKHIAKDGIETKLVWRQEVKRNQGRGR